LKFVLLLQMLLDSNISVRYNC